MGAAVEHVEAYEIAATRLGPGRDPCAGEPGLEHFLHGCEFGFEQPTLLVHMRGDPGIVAQHPDMAQLIELVGPDRARRVTRDKPAHIDSRRREQSEAGLRESDL